MSKIKFQVLYWVQNDFSFLYIWSGSLIFYIYGPADLSWFRKVDIVKETWTPPVAAWTRLNPHPKVFRNMPGHHRSRFWVGSGRFGPGSGWVQPRCAPEGPRTWVDDEEVRVVRVPWGENTRWFFHETGFLIRLNLRTPLSPGHQCIVRLPQSFSAITVALVNPLTCPE